MPFGLRNAPAVFQRFIHHCLKEFIAAGKIIVYMDDILIATADLSDHIAVLTDLLCCLSAQRLELNLSKCKFAYTTVDFLGYSASANGIQPNDSHVRSITKYPMPTTIKQVRSCLGLFQYFRKFIPNFARIAYPLQRLLRNDARFDINEACVQAFNELKEKLMSKPVLANFCRDRETELHTDASAVGFGAVLLQRQDDGKMHPVFYYSKATSPEESRRHSFELETLAIIYALDRLKSYLHGSPFTIVTDCNALSLTFDKKNMSPRISRWALTLQHFDYKIQHRSGVLMTHADALSRGYELIETEPIDHKSQILSRIVALCERSKTDTDSDADTQMTPDAEITHTADDESDEPDFLGFEPETAAETTDATEIRTDDDTDTEPDFQGFEPEPAAEINDRSRTEEPVYEPDTTNDTADATETRPDDDEMAEQELAKTIQCRTVRTADQVELDFLIQATQSRDENILRLRTQLEDKRVTGYELKDGLVFRRDKLNRLQLMVPLEMENNIIRLVHEKVCHMGVDKTYDQLRMTYHFENMRSKVEIFIKNCIRCIMCSPPVRINNRNLYSIPKKPEPFDTIHVDHFGPLPAINSQRKHILVVIDAFTKFVKLYAVKSTSTKEVIACMDKYIEAYSRPRRIISDRGTCFTSLEFSEYLLSHNMEHVKVAVASPQANGQVERVNRVIKAMLSKTTDPMNHSDWTKMLSEIEFALNNSVHSSTRNTPSRLLFGVDQRGKIIDYMTEYLQNKHTEPPQQTLRELRDDAADAIKKSQETNERLFAKKNKPPEIFTEGEFVVIRHLDTTIGTNKKLIEKYRGPYVVHKILPNDRYVIRDVDNCQLTQIPYNGVVEACRIRKWVER